MKAILMFLATLMSTSFVFAYPNHTGFCRYGEPCEGIVSRNLREAQRICSREPFDKEVLPVYQEQRDGSVVFVGYVCISPPSA